MSVNKERPHVFVLPEDDANRQLANGFFLDPSFWNRGTSFHVLIEAGGWTYVRDCFISVHIREMEKYPERFMILLIDFDNRLERLIEMKEAIPANLIDRVFIIGTLKTPEALKRDVHRSLETIGLSLARDCREETDTTWNTEHLQHNADELKHLRKHVRPILFA